MNKFILVTCESDSRYLISSLHVVLLSSYPNISNLSGVARVSSAVNPELSLSTIKTTDDHDNE